MSRETQPTNGRLVWISDDMIRSGFDVVEAYDAAPENAVEAVNEILGRETCLTVHDYDGEGAKWCMETAVKVLQTLGMPPVVSPPVGEDA